MLQQGNNKFVHKTCHKKHIVNSERDKDREDHVTARVLRNFEEIRAKFDKVGAAFSIYFEIVIHLPPSHRQPSSPL